MVFIVKNFIWKVSAIALALSLTGCSTADSELDLVEPSIDASFFDQPVKDEITVYIFDPYLIGYLSEAANLFGRTYPNVKVNIEMFGQLSMSSEEVSQAIYDYITMLNTEIMSGKGPDIIAIDLPYYKYAESGAFVDMQQYMVSDPGFFISDYRENIFDAIKYKGHQYVLPTDYYLNFFSYDASFFTNDERAQLRTSDKFSITQLIEFGKEPFNRAGDTYMFALGGDFQHPSMFKFSWETNYRVFANLANKKANFNDGRFVEFLKSVSDYVNAGYIKEQVPENELKWQVNQEERISAEDIEAELGMSCVNEHYIYKMLNITQLLDYLSTINEDLDKWHYVYGFGNVENDVMLGAVADDDGNVSFNFTHAYAMNTNSTNKRTAWEFIKFLVSENMQCSTELWGTLPVNKKAFEKKSKLLMNENFYYTSSVNRTLELTLEQQEVFDTYVAWVDKISAEINTYTVMDTTVDAMITEELENYFENTKTANDVAQTLQYKLDLFMNE